MHVSTSVKHCYHLLSKPHFFFFLFLLFFPTENYHIPSFEVPLVSKQKKEHKTLFFFWFEKWQLGTALVQSSLNL